MKWLEVLDTIPKLVRVAIVAGGLLGLGWTGHIIFGQTIGLPRMLAQTVGRVEILETRMDRFELETENVGLLETRVDSLFRLQRDTYCLVRAHTYGLDPDLVCREIRR